MLWKLLSNDRCPLNSMNDHPVSMTVNGRPVTVTVPSRESLADSLRYRLRLTGTKVGCEQGVCGSCTVIVDGKLTRSCLMLSVQAENAAVWTIEGLSQDDALSPIQEEFRVHGALQCGFCTPGMVVTALVLLSGRSEPPSREEIREGLSGNICRCTGYGPIVDAVYAASRHDLTLPYGMSESGKSSFVTLDSSDPGPWSLPGDTPPAEPETSDRARTGRGRGSRRGGLGRLKDMFRGGRPVGSGPGDE